MTVVCTRGRTATAHDRAVVDAFAAFLELRAGVDQRIVDGRYTAGDQLPPWLRYALRLAAWRIGAHVPRQSSR